MGDAQTHAGMNEGGVLVVHHDAELEDSASCEALVIPPGCGELTTRAAADSSPKLWFVLAAFPDSVADRLNTVAFGLGDYDDSDAVITDWGPCELFGDVLEVPGEGWPGPNTGTAVSWAPECGGGRLVPIYWFVTYAYASETIPLTAHPSQSSTLVDCISLEEDTIAGYGAMGFGTERGLNPCPGNDDGPDGPQDGGGDSPEAGTTWTVGGQGADCETIQECIDLAAAGDTVLVAAGTYVENIRFRGLDIVVQSEDGPGETVIDGGSPDYPDSGSVVYFPPGHTRETVLRGFSIEHGRGTVIELVSPPAYEKHGGGIFIGDASPTIDFCEIRRNRSSSISLDTLSAGGGIAIIGSLARPLIDNCVVESDSSFTGGGIAVLRDAAPSIHSTLISANRTVTDAYGFGLIFGGAGLSFFYSDPAIGDVATIWNCTIVDNKNDGWRGGGFAINSENPSILDCVISRNTAHQHGGGIWGSNEASPRIEHCWFEADSALIDPPDEELAVPAQGGAVCIDEAELGDVSIAHNTFVRNYSGFRPLEPPATETAFGGAIAFVGVGGPALGETRVVNNTFVENDAMSSGGTIAVIEGFTDGRIMIDENIIVSPSGNACPIRDEVRESIVTADCNLFWPTPNCEGYCFCGENGIVDDPLFCDADNDDFHLDDDSPAGSSGDCGLLGAWEIEGCDPASVSQGISDVLDAVFLARPNPGMGMPRFELILPREAKHVSLTLHEVTGRKIADVFQGSLGPGPHSLGWQARGAQTRLRSGVYLARLEWDGARATSKVVVLR